MAGATHNASPSPLPEPAFWLIKATLVGDERDETELTKRAQYHHHVPSFKNWWALNLGDVFQVLDDPFQNLLAQLGVRHFAPPVHDYDFDLVAVLQEPFHVVYLELVIVLAYLGTHLDFFDMRHMLVFLGNSGALGLLILVLAVVHDATYGRVRVWSYLHQIKFGSAGKSERLVNRHYSELRALLADHPDGLGADLPVNSSYLVSYIPSPPTVVAQQRTKTCQRYGAASRKTKKDSLSSAVRLPVQTL